MNLEMTFINKLNNEINNLWNQAALSETLGRQPLYYHELKKNCVLFIGINPSFSSRGFESYLKDSNDFSRLNAETFYKHPNSNFDINESIEIEKEARKKYSYFKKFHVIDEDYEHIDLFLIRETNQAKLKKIIYRKGETLSEFAKKQIDIFHRILLEINPRVIVVANALASQIIQTEFDTQIDNEKGCHILPINGKAVPIFYTSMLTGQRALDNFSFERLKWHLDFVMAST
ncbi:hypothetical protein WCX49_07135 [Sulfurimonas sp. HSL-1656]|uniref:hypothetical protein n=1 Tax=Thiomicrolovo subterrani TaxID=3131934 RepID=UPI0031F9A9CC